MENKKVKSVEKKIYTLLIEGNQSTFLGLQSAYSLEEAFFLSKLEFEKMSPEKRGTANLLGAKIGLFASKPYSELDKETSSSPSNAVREKKGFMNRDDVAENFEGVEDFFDLMDGVKVIPLNKPEIKEEVEKVLTPADIKNRLMKKIIDEKNKEMFEANKELFNKEERKYIQTLIN